MCISIELDINMVYYKMFVLKCYKVKIIICGYLVYFFFMIAIIF